MVAASRSVIVVAVALASSACGTILPPAEELADEAPANEPVTTKGANMPAPSGNGETGVSVGDAPADAAPPPAPPSSSKSYSVFVTSQVFAPDRIGGLSGADGECASLAGSSAKLQGKKWAAWLSTDTVAAIDRLGSTPGPWVRVDGTPVAADQAQVVDDLLPFFAPISVDERGAFHSDGVWTGTRADGGPSNDTCGGWNGTTGRGLYGKISFVKPTWTEDGDVDCDGGSWSGSSGGGSGPLPRKRLYCFEID